MAKPFFSANDILNCDLPITISRGPPKFKDGIVTITQIAVSGATAGSVSVGGSIDGPGVVAASQTLGAAGNLVLTSGTVTLSVDQRLTLTGAGDNSAVIFTFTGTNVDGLVFTTTSDGPNARTVFVEVNNTYGFFPARSFYTPQPSGFDPAVTSYRPVNGGEFVWLPAMGRNNDNSSATANNPTGITGIAVRVTDAMCLPQAVAGAGAMTVNGRFATNGVFYSPARNTVLSAFSSALETGTITANGFNSTQAIKPTYAGPFPAVVLTNPYNRGDIVTSGGLFYIALFDIASAVAPASDTTNWAVALTETLTFTASQTAVETGSSIALFVEARANQAFTGFVRVGQGQGLEIFINSQGKASRETKAFIAYTLGYDPSFYTPYLTHTLAPVALPGATTTTVLGTDPLVTTIDTKRLLVNQTAHGYTDGQSVIIKDAVEFNGAVFLDIRDMQVVSRINGVNSWEIAMSDFPSAAGAGGGTPQVTSPGKSCYIMSNDERMSATNGSSIIKCTRYNNLMLTGESVIIKSFSGLLVGMSNAKLDGTKIVTVNDEDHWSFTATGTPATGDAPGMGTNTIVFFVAPLVVRAGSNRVYVRWLRHGLQAVYDSVTLVGFTAVGTITAPQINITAVVGGVVNNSLFWIVTAGTAVADAVGGGSGTVTSVETTRMVENKATAPIRVTGVSVSGPTVGNVSVGGIYDGVATVAALQSRGSAGALTLTGSPVTMSQRQEVTITAVGNNSGVNFTITGESDFDTNYPAGIPFSITVQGPNNNTVMVPDSLLAQAAIQFPHAGLNDVCVVPYPKLDPAVLAFSLDYEPAGNCSQQVCADDINDIAAICHGATPRRTFQYNGTPLDQPSAGGSGLTDWSVQQFINNIDWFCLVLTSTLSYYGEEVREAFRVQLAQFGAISAGNMAKLQLNVGYGIEFIGLLSITSVSVNGATSGPVTVGGDWDGAAVVCASQTSGGAGLLTMTASPYVFRIPQNLTVTCAGDNSARIFTVVGVDEKGNAFSLSNAAGAGPNNETIKISKVNLGIAHTLESIRVCREIILTNPIRKESYVTPLFAPGLASSDPAHDTHLKTATLSMGWKDSKRRRMTRWV